MQRTYHFVAMPPTRAEGEVLAALVEVGRRRDCAGGTPVLHRGDPGTGFWLIESGHVMACRFGPEGERTLFAVLGPGDLIGEVACFAGVTQQVDAITEGEASLVWIEMAQVDRLMANKPHVARWLLGTLANKLRAALDRVEGDQSLSAQARIARVLVDLAAREGAELTLTQQQLADHVGVSRVTTGQVLARIAQEGAIERGYGGVRVLSVERLAAWSA
ncbi:Crp/Fnr family transcriptional regulator [Qipengyuania soli]|uniref:Crp/Fnr family transcriptional regulator n=1 Tax=Qipengyuania soli TaxID=2782568 RepID=A0A7S8F5K4_9SPHN|nr:Crp/Fnr family transcriptional regulator [Qipengyuania soli]QPC99551.1 Crp/Fnr family transcriptional regulator [Qipengyuania soli]